MSEAFPTLRGSLEPFLQDEWWDFDPTRGFIHGASYRGASQENMRALRDDFVRLGISCRLLFKQGDTAELTVDDQTQEYAIDVWEIDDDEPSKDLFSHPSVDPLIRQILGYLVSDGDQATMESVADVLSAIKSHLENDDLSSIAFGVPGQNQTGTLAKNLNPFRGTLLQRFYDQYQAGQTDFLDDGYVIKHTTNISNRSAMNIADFNVRSIYSPAKLLSEISNPSLWAFPAPNRTQYKIANIPTPATIPPYYSWGWLKSGSRESTAANNRVNIVQTYTLALWGSDRYTVYA